MEKIPNNSKFKTGEKVKDISIDVDDTITKCKCCGNWIRIKKKGENNGKIKSIFN